MNRFQRTNQPFKKTNSVGLVPRAVRLTPEEIAIAVTLAALSFVLGFLSVRGFVHSLRGGDPHQVVWAVGLSMATAAMVIELLAYVGIVTEPLLQAYVFFSAAIVGVLSLGTLRAFHHENWNRTYFGYTSVALAALAVLCFSTPMPLSMVQSGVISANPPLSLLILSSFITGPATILLLYASVSSLRRSFRWRGLTMMTGAVVLGAGGLFYIASFPVMLYYAEFVGIILLFVGLVDFSRWSAALRRPAPARDTPPA